MSTLLDRRPAHREPAHASDFSGTVGLLRLYLRRDRVVLPLWVLLLSVPVATVYVGSTEAVYPSAADRATFAATIMASPAQRALYGNIYSESVGAVGVWKAGMFVVLIAVAAILTVIRHTRGDEETGRTELIDSTAVGRYAGLTAALLLAGGACVLTGLITIAGLLTLDIPAAGSVAFGLALAASGLVFTALAAVTAQLSASARFARSAAFSVLAAAFTLRAVGDAAGAEGNVLSWLSPLGWSLQVRPFAGDRWWVLILHVTLTALLVGLAYRLLAHRDVGAGMFTERPGRPTAGHGLRGAFGLAQRLDRGALLLWTIGLCLYGLVIGSVVHGIADQVGSSATARDMVMRLGGTGAMEEAFVAVAFSMLAMIGAAFAISLTLRLHQEETSQHAETVLATSVSRTRWLASHLLSAIVGSAAALLLAGVVAGLTYGAAAGDIGAKLPVVVATAAMQLPAVWLLAAVTVAIFGVAPRFTPLAWGVLVGFIALFMLGSLSGFPQLLLDLEPFVHTPSTGDFTATPLLWLLSIDVALLVVGVAAFRRRDLR